MELTRRTRPKVAYAVGRALKQHGVTAVLSGGACASFQNCGAYTPVNLDYILAGSPEREVVGAMASVGFARRGITTFVRGEARRTGGDPPVPFPSVCRDGA